jgi:hypothetical protein
MNTHLLACSEIHLLVVIQNKVIIIIIKHTTTADLTCSQNCINLKNFETRNNRNKLSENNVFLYTAVTCSWVSQ